MNKLIGISGKIGSGKDTAALIIKILSVHSELSDKSIAHMLTNPSPTLHGSDWTVKKFAGKLKEVASLLTGVPAHKFEDQDFKKTNLSSDWQTWYPYIDRPEPMTVREFLQKLGTEAMRQGLHTNVWVNALFADYTRVGRFVRVTEDKLEEWEDGEFPNWIITDCRFPNEAVAIREREGVLLRLNRNGETGEHISETALDNFEFDYVIENTGSLEELVAKIRVFYDKYFSSTKDDTNKPTQLRDILS
jgi:hypothetical protein